MAKINDEDLRLMVNAAQNDEGNAFELLVRMYEKKAYALALSIAGNTADAQDITQEAFVKLYLNIKSFHWDSSFNAWFYRIVHNTAIDALRKKQRKKAVSLDESFPDNENERRYDIPSKSASPEEISEQDELKRLLLATLQELSEEHRTILVMRDMEDASYEEIAVSLNCPIGTVKSRISRARAALKAKVLKNKEQYTGHLRFISSKGGSEL